MQNKNQPPLTIKVLNIVLSAVLLSTLGAGSLSSVGVQKATAMTTAHVLSNGQFVYGPNIGDFVLKTYFEANAPHLLKYSDDLYGRSKYFSINPKIYLTLLEVHSHLISKPDFSLIEDPFGLSNGDFISQIEYISNKMSDAYYLHLYTYSAMPVSQRRLDSFITPSGNTIDVAPDTDAGTYAIIAGLAALDQQNISFVLDNSQPDGFYQTYARLFENDDALDETNHIYIPGEVDALAAPDNLLQFPWLQGQSWFFSGVHSNGSGGSGAPFTNAAALDFSPGSISWGGDTSNMWVAATAAGIPTKTSNCGFSILHGGGWETGYYHIENIQNFSGTINQNDKIGVIANTLAEATCAGGNASGPHVHFYLSHNGALTAINGTPLSGWNVHAGRWEYDTDPNYMWLERAGLKKYANVNKVLSEAPPSPSTSTCATSAASRGTVMNLGNEPVDAIAELVSLASGGHTTGVFRPSNGLLYLKNANISGFADLAINYGTGGDCPVTGDWDGNGTDTIGIYRNGVFYLRNSNTIGFADIVFAFGLPGDQPVAGDWNGDGIDTVGVYRSSSITFMLRNSNSAGAPDVTFLLGIQGDVGIVGDWNGDGVDTTGVFRPSNGVIFLKNANTSGFADIALNYGLSGDQPVTGDWNGDGIDTIGVYRKGQFLLRNSNTIGFADIVFALGIPGDMPIAGDWDGQ